MVDTNGLQLAIDVEMAKTELTLTYEIRNTTHEKVYLLNRLWKSDGNLRVDPDIIYIHLDQDTEAVHLYKKLADLPSGKTVTAPVAPFVTPVVANGVFRETVHIPVPVKQYLQYGNDSSSGHPAVYRLLDFCVGYYWGATGVTEVTRTTGGTTVVMPQFPAGSRPRFGVICTAPQSLAVPVVGPRK